MSLLRGEDLLKCAAVLSRHQHLLAPAALALGIAILAGLVLAGSAIRPVAAGKRLAALSPQLEAGTRGHTRVLDPVTVTFDDDVDLVTLRLALTPPQAFQVKPVQHGFSLVPSGQWAPAQQYTLGLHQVWNAGHTRSLQHWSATFATQPQVSVAGFLAAGRPVADNATIRVRAPLAVAFTVPMDPASTRFAVNDRPVEGPAWSANGTSATFVPDVNPYQRFTVKLLGGAVSAAGDQLTDQAGITLNTIPVLPSNSGSGVPADFSPPPPVQIVIENSGPAKPQAGMQDADTVFEYLSEYGITRWTAVYMNRVASNIGPVRSCRMINAYLDFALTGVEMCSGASVGTLHYLFGNHEGAPLAPGIINDFDQGGHFFRVNFKPAPHNVYTTADRAERLRSEWGLPGRPYAVDPPHPDTDPGQPAPPPGVPQHGAAYGYDGGSREYLRFDQGSPLVDTNTNRQVSAKNVIVVHTRFHDAGWVEDENGGAHSIWYDLTGDGPAEIFTRGRVVHGAWHMGAPGQQYYENHQPMWFSDESGRFLELNTGLTWVHVLGDGQ